MKLQGRTLSINMVGGDVALLHVELRQLGFKILSQELKKKRFGKSTSQAVRDFQKQHKLRVTGKVQEKTATAINLESAAPQLDAPRLKPVIMKLTGKTLSSGVKGQDVKLLHEGLQQLGYTIEGKERKARRFGKSTSEAILDFQKKYHLESTGGVDQRTVALLNTATTYRAEGNTPEMRQNLKEAVEKTQEAPELAYWLARYEILAGNYVDAHNAMSRAPEFLKMKEEIEPILSLSSRSRRQAPEMAHPSNFYTYRNSLVDNHTIGARKFEAQKLIENPEVDSDTKARLELIVLYLDCLSFWNQANGDILRRNYTSAENNYDRFYDSVFTYFASAYPQLEEHLDQSKQSEVNLVFLREVFSTAQVKFIGLFPLPPIEEFLNHFSERVQALTLDELFNHDWIEPKRPSDLSGVSMYDKLARLLTGFFLLHRRRRKFEAPLLIMSLIFVPLALAETKRLRHQFQSALGELKKVLVFHHLVDTNTDRILNDFIERPFLTISRAQVLLDRADSEYKARITLESPNPADSDAFPKLRAAGTYRSVLELLEEEGQYVGRVQSGAESLKETIAEVLERPFLPAKMLDDNNTPEEVTTQRHEFEILSKTMPIETIEPASETLPGLDRRFGPHEGLTMFVPPNNEPTLKETNPLIYALVIEAQARLMQIEAEFNYLGYHDTYVPPWRFQFLLERARYFAEHAKNAQREYLNFLSNAEREEFQEVTLAQSVELEKSNVRIETARVEQTRLEVEANKVSEELAILVAQNAEDRLGRFESFDTLANRREFELKFGSTLGFFGSALSGAQAGGLGALGGLFSGASQVVTQEAQIAIAAEQREVEKFNLLLAEKEARLSSAVATAQLNVAQQGLVVAGMQRTVALLRHEFAVQNLAFLRGRVLNAEAWHRLANLIRSISATYMRYAVELAFLAEQAYEFEADKRINVIRFDYDVSDERGLLAADFLLRDLDTVEHDFVVSQRQSQQQVRYVFSLAREFPEALQDLRDTGSTIFSLRLEQLERRFPGLFNIRIASVEVTPVALMDPTRFSLELTNVGISQVRLKAHPDTMPGVDSPSVLNVDDLEFVEQQDDEEEEEEEQEVEDLWLADFRKQWPIKVRVTGPETFVFSGLSQQDRSAAFPFASTSQRNAFEGLGAAATWRMDMSLKENQVVPGTLADILIAFTLSGYHDAFLRHIVDNAQRQPSVPTQWLSARQSFADAYYLFNRSGRMDWEVTELMLSLGEPVGLLRNLAVVLFPLPRRLQFGPLMANHIVEFKVTDAGALEVLNDIPRIRLERLEEELTINAMAEVASGSTVLWAFEDDNFQEGAEQQHVFSRTGRHDVSLRVINEGRLSEFRGQLTISRDHDLDLPLTAVPLLSVTSVDESGDDLQVTIAGNIETSDISAITGVWKLNSQRGVERGTSVEFEPLKPGTYSLAFSAVRILKARVSSHQRQNLQEEPFELNGLSLATNRTFDDDEETPPLNALAIHLFEEGPISPVDTWSFELSLEDNPFLRSVTQTDVEEIDFSEIADIALTLEYETTGS